MMVVVEYMLDMFDWAVTQLAWFRLYDDIVDDPKMEGFSHSQQWLWITTLCMANRSPQRGKLLLVGERSPTVPGNGSSLIALPFRVLAKKANMTEEQVSVTWALFERMGMVHQEEGIWCISNWDSRQFKSDDVTERTRKFKQKSKREQPRNVPENAEGTDQKQTQKQKQTVPPTPQEGGGGGQDLPSEKTHDIADALGRVLEGKVSRLIFTQRDRNAIAKWVAEGYTDPAVVGQAINEALEAKRAEPGVIPTWVPDHPGYYTGWVRQAFKEQGENAPPPRASPKDPLAPEKPHSVMFEMADSASYYLGRGFASEEVDAAVEQVRVWREYEARRAGGPEHAATG